LSIILHHLPMNRWHHVTQLYHAALEKEAREREAFLDDACAGDESLRAEVESLLAREKDASQFMKSLALEVVARSWAHDPNDSLAGRTIAHYKILSLLGAGGMGQVYLAEDIRLDRNVALKVLPPEVALDPDRMKRFISEAKAASALNHPNVATVHDIG